MKEEERRIHKERRKKQKRQRKERQKEKVKQERFDDRRPRIQNEMEHVVQERISRELERNTVNVGNAENANQETLKNKSCLGKKGSTPVSCKRISETRQGGVPQKKARAAASLTEISLCNIKILPKLLGSGSYGKCYIASYREMDVVCRKFMEEKIKNETHG